MTTCDATNPSNGTSTKFPPPKDWGNTFDEPCHPQEIGEKGIWKLTIKV